MIDSERYRVTAAGVSLRDHDPEDTGGFDGGKKKAKAALREMIDDLAELQRRLWAESEQSLLVVLQALDTGGKDGTIRHVFRGVNPQGVHIRGFGVPTEWEAGHDFLWRIHQHTPEDGAIAIFNRSHYEDVLVTRVKDLVEPEVWMARYEHIRNFEHLLAEEGTTIVKFFLNISRAEQKKRLERRLRRPDKRWKFHKGDLEDRRLWGSYMEAYEGAINETAAPHAPWYVVPADKKWYRNLVVGTVVLEALRRMGPEYPEPEEDLEGVVVK